MDLLVTLTVGVASALLTVIDVCFLVRALLSWFPISEDHVIVRLVVMITEPIVLPVRLLFERLGWFQNTPVDISFLIAYFLLIMLSGALLGI